MQFLHNDQPFKISSMICSISPRPFNLRMQQSFTLTNEKSQAWFMRIQLLNQCTTTNESQCITDLSHNSHSPQVLIPILVFVLIVFLFLGFFFQWWRNDKLPPSSIIFSFFSFFLLYRLSAIRKFGVLFFPLFLSQHKILFFLFFNSLFLVLVVLSADFLCFQHTLSDQWRQLCVSKMKDFVCLIFHGVLLFTKSINSFVPFFFGMWSVEKGSLYWEAPTQLLLWCFWFTSALLGE